VLPEVKPLVLTFEILQCLANQQSSNATK